MVLTDMVFELRNKVPQNSGFLYSEDVLTGTIFGCLRYFRNQHLLIHFLNESINLYGDKLLLNENSNYEILFWKKYSSSNSNSYNEPDLLLYNNNEVIIIECKYFSFLDEEIIEEKGKKRYRNQLIRYASVIDEYYNNKQYKNIIFLTNDKKMPRDILNETIREVKEIYNNINLYWLSWNKLHTVICSNYSLYSIDNNILLSDLVNFLEKRRLYYFEGFKIEEIKYRKFYKKEYNFSFSDYLFEWRYLQKIHYYFSTLCSIDDYQWRLYENYYFAHIKKIKFNWRYHK